MQAVVGLRPRVQPYAEPDKQGTENQGVSADPKYERQRAGGGEEY